MQDSYRIVPKIESLVAHVMPDITSKFQEDPFVTSWVIFLTHRQTNKLRQKHYLLGGGIYFPENKLPKLANFVQFIRRLCLCFVWRIGGLGPLGPPWLRHCATR